MSFKSVLILVAVLVSLSCINTKNLPKATILASQTQPFKSDISGKILSGYQGWFNAEGDGANLGWKHYTKNREFKPGKISIDYWPDLSEFDKDELYKTPFKLKNGTNANIFSSANPKTVNRHFKWMNDYNIDGVFIQRFVISLTKEKMRANLNVVYDNAFIGAKQNDRLISVMYDLSGTKDEDVVKTTKKDWKRLVDNYQVNNPNNKNVLTYKGKAVVAIWGVGFKDRDYSLESIKELIDFFKNDPKYGNCAVLLGVPTGWRELNRDCIPDKEVHKIIKSADIVHPWTPGRYRDLETVDKYTEEYTLPDKKWCDANNLMYMPVVFPGFSWYNLKGGDSKSAEIPRLKGDFLWRQFHNVIAAKAETMYVAMFDEMDEGTCIFKVTDNPPVGKSRFLDYEGLPSDYYLWLTGKAGEMLRKEIPLSKTQPKYKAIK